MLSPRYGRDMRSLTLHGATPRIDPDMTIDEIMRRWPATVRIVMRHNMLCVGCPIGSFHTVTEACHEHQVDEEAFVAELLAAMNG